MADEDKASKTEEPTDRRIEEARKEGNVPNSREISSFAVLLGGALFIIGILPWAADGVAVHLANFLARAHVFRLERDSFAIGIFEATVTFLPYVLVPAILFAILGIVAQVGQVGLLVTTKPLTPKLDKLSPIRGIKRIFSLKQLLEIVKGIVKITFVVIIAYFVLRPVWRQPQRFVDQDIVFTMRDLHERLIALIVGVLLMMTVIAAMDLVFTRFKYREDLRMTKQEIKDEHKSSEGDPQVKARIRSLRAERARKRMMQAVPTADVVVTNPTHFAVALKYDMATMQAPRLVAKGQDHLALRIRTLAEENNVPVVENPPLARALYAAVDLDQEITPEHYQAVAEVIGYVMRLRKTFH
ncbi:flagellar biosynthesis protein FlhB [Roseospira marina]|uniref:Flagellar biosynthetic protein FlhB n=1 Tax=Roseospira marina TaxID=140057 RepID=A0A5M6I8N8_9PROT|nr:flagellar biosynthesis protein FlhB [Roseospira marina]KAA5604512.1 flagellar biosynthesis protein FlhB [Roseospira marina]MBB4315569.1 flagellar biosynthetic protein FlhB [Roseospira marina]MBB5088494.1 flagellar biosynthetic protein FlhB [Roseospira marina]